MVGKICGKGFVEKSGVHIGGVSLLGIVRLRRWGWREGCIEARRVESGVRFTACPLQPPLRQLGGWRALFAQSKLNSVHFSRQIWHLSFW